jgi:hypothetical protein
MPKMLPYPAGSDTSLRIDPREASWISNVEI